MELSTVIDLVVATSYAKHPSLALVIERFSRLGRLIWLAQEDSPVPSSLPHVPIVASASEIQNSGRLTLLIAPPDTGSSEIDEIRGTMRVFERSSPAWRTMAQAVVVDDFSRLELLSTLPGYPGLCRLLECQGWTSRDFCDAILDRYATALDALQTKKCAAVFGAQRLGELVCSSLRSSGITVSAFIDNGTKKHGTSISGVLVQPLSSLSDKSMPIMIATTRFSNSIARQLEEEGFKHVLPYSVMSLVAPVSYPDEIPYNGIQQDFADHAANYLGLFLALSDDKSRRVLDGLIRYRLDYDSRFANAVADEYARQYFDVDLIKFSSEDVFVDLGGYDGDTVEKFIEFGEVGFKRIYLFEPDENLMARAVERLASFREIEFIPAGAYSRDGELRFATTGRTNGAISEVGEMVIPVRVLDSVVREKPTLIKIDIEGAETEALRGATNLLRSARPKLAIAAYHFAPDIWRLADVVRDINPAYQFYLRHYSETGLESVLYAI